MSHSLQRRLARKLGTAIVVFGLIAALTSFALTFEEAREFQDDMLRQIAVLSASHLPDTALPDARISDPEARVEVFHAPGPRLPAWLAQDLKPGFHTLEGVDTEMRVFVHRTAQNQLTMVAQATDARDEIAWNSALRTLIPLVLLLPLLTWLIVRLLRDGFTPVVRLTQRLDEQAADRPTPLELADVPSEVLPFVQAINRLLARSGELMQQQRRFIADAAHELRSPLTALSLQVQNLRQVDSPEALRARIEPLHDGVERARQLTEQLLGLARTQAGTDDMVTIDMPVLARQLLAEFLPRAEAVGIDIGLEENARVHLLTAPESLRLIISNALDNALKYTPTGGAVTLRLDREGNDALIEVIDTGPGIPGSEYGRVFDPFYRVPGSQGIGSGLGLSIAREAAARNGGTVTLRAGPDDIGLVFRYRQTI
ncbi:MAG: two-component sensor histidine kinase [Gammaproteobacteria bacterium]|nr:two-component sensor histidine kinase [Gammaproteobacteria bacterium]MCP5137074.1 two-component sensor histidine kinase [Gammaproteobacteria bacterium]